MTKFLVETISFYRMRYVVEANDITHANDEVTMSATGGPDIVEFSQHWVSEDIMSTREIDDTEYLRLFDEDNYYAKGWTDEKKLSYVNVIEYPEQKHTACGTPECCGTPDCNEIS